MYFQVNLSGKLDGLGVGGKVHDLRNWVNKGTVSQEMGRGESVIEN